MSWKKIKLGDVLNNRIGKYKSNDPSISNLRRIDKINFSGEMTLSNKPSNTDMILIKKGDLVISGINVEKGALAVYEGDDDVLATIHYSSYTFDKKKIDIDFLKVFLKSPDFIQLLKEQVPGGIKTEIKPKHLLPLEVYFPDTIAEQQEIAKHFCAKELELKVLNNLLDSQLTQLTNLNQAILQEAVQGKLVEQDPTDEPATELLKRIKAEKEKSGKKEKPLPPIKPEEIPFEIPDSWVWCRLGEICEIITDGTHQTPNYFKEGFVFLSSKNVTSGIIDWINVKYIDKKQHDEMQKRVSPKFNDILLAKNGTTGVAALVDKDMVFDIYVSLALLRPIHGIYPQFLLHYINSIIAKRQFNKRLRGVGVKNLHLNQIQEIVVPVPPLNEQIKIVPKIEKQFAKTKQLKENIIANQQGTEQLLKALLAEAFEGKDQTATATT